MDLYENSELCERDTHLDVNLVKDRTLWVDSDLQVRRYELRSFKKLYMHRVDAERAYPGLGCGGRSWTLAYHLTSVPTTITFISVFCKSSHYIQ